VVKAGKAKPERREAPKKCRLANEELLRQIAHLDSDDLCRMVCQLRESLKQVRCMQNIRSNCLMPEARN